MHGLGADGHDFVPLVPELALPETLPVRFVFPHAPTRPVTVNRGYVMRPWYDVRDDTGERRADEAGVRDSHTRIEALIEREKARGIAAARIVLAGFSQGGAMALHPGLAGHGAGRALSAGSGGAADRPPHALRPERHVEVPDAEGA